MDEWSIRRLEHWHRVWEIKNPQLVVVPTFATIEEITHQHQLVRDFFMGRESYHCLDCRVHWGTFDLPLDSVIIQ